MKLKSIHIENVNSISDVTVELNDISIITGSNGSGKSTVIQSIYLALLGYIPGQNKTNSGVFKHCKYGNKYMRVKLMLSHDGSNHFISRCWTKVKNSVNCEVNVSDGLDIESAIKQIELPVFNFSEFSAMSANQMKDWFLQMLKHDSEEIDWNALLKKHIDVHSEYSDKYAATIADQIISDYCNDDIKSINTFLKSMLSAVKNNKIRLENTASSMIFYEDIDTESEESLRHELEVLKEKRAEAIHAKTTNTRNAEIRDILSNVHVYADSYENDPRYVAIKSKLDDGLSCRTKYMALYSKVDKELTILISRINQIESVVERGSVCPYTDVECASLSDSVTNAKQELEQLTQKRKQLVDERWEYLNAIPGDSKLEELQNKLGDIKNTYTMNDTLSKTLCEDIPHEDISEIDDKITDIQSKIEKCVANKQYQAVMNSIVADKLKADIEMSCLKSWVDLTGVNGMQSEAAVSSFNSLSDNLTEELHNCFGNNVSNYFNLSDKSNSFEFGITIDSHSIPYSSLSTGERCMYMIALLKCILNSSDSCIKIMIIDDLLDHLDDNNIMNVFNYIRTISDNSEIQMICAGVYKNCPTELEPYIFNTSKMLS